MADSASPQHSSNPQLTAILFCREVILEANTGMISPFRLVQRAEIPIPNVVTDLTIWQGVSVHLFVGVDCHGTELDHEHALRMKGFAPSGEMIGDKSLGPAKISKDEPIAYVNIELNLPGSIAGKYRFEVWLDEKLAGTTYFTVRHKRIDIPGHPPEYIEG